MKFTLRVLFKSLILSTSNAKGDASSATNKINTYASENMHIEISV